MAVTVALNGTTAMLPAIDGHFISKTPVNLVDSGKVEQVRIETVHHSKLN